MESGASHKVSTSASAVVSRRIAHLLRTGAAAAAILTALVEDPSRHPKPFKFAILSAGFLPLDPAFRTLFEGPVSSRPRTPTLHVLGRGDTLVGAGECHLTTLPLRYHVYRHACLCV